MSEIERVAREHGRWLLVLDTASDAAERLYRRMGWRLSGMIPCYALNPDKTLTHTSVYWKQLIHPPAMQVSVEAVGGRRE